MADATAHTVITFGHLTHALSSMCIICVLYCTQYRTALYCTVLSVLLFFEYLLFDVCITYSILSMYWNDGDCLCSIFPVQTQYFLFLLGVFLTANETYFFLQGKTLPANMKRRRKNPWKFCREPREIFTRHRAKYSKST